MDVENKATGASKLNDNPETSIQDKMNLRFGTDLAMFNMLEQQTGC